MLYEKIIDKFNDIKNIEYSLSLLNWDQSIYMPKTGIDSRANTMATLTKIGHSLLISDDFYNLLCEITQNDEINKLSGIQQKEVLKIKEDVEKERKIPISLATELSKITSLAMAVWEDAKNNNDDSEFLPILQKVFDLKKEYAKCIGYKDNPYDALLNCYDKGLEYSYVKPIFENLEKNLLIILDKIKNSTVKIKENFLQKDFDIKKQWDFGISILKEIGLDANSFRQDSSAHPFTTRIGIDDVRITTRITADNFKSGFFSTIHEGGHCFYELNACKIFNYSPHGIIESLSLHESQSRFYENIIARSLNFWQSYYPQLKENFNSQLQDISLETFYNSINKVELTPIRVESDEVTYNLHIILRSQIENSIINNEIDVFDIEEFWNEKTKKILGFHPSKKNEGYLQDIHWSCGLFGYFPTYALGNLISAQFYYKMLDDIGISQKIDQSYFNKIYQWFNKNLYSKGSIYPSKDVVQMITNEELNSDYFIKYLDDKFSKIYNF